jgi:FtsP/CotA-like multicopper oxidase with cupredoxin domain
MFYGCVEPLDPLTIPKYVTPLVIPPVMNSNVGTPDDYSIAVRQFKQQILPGGIWNTINGRSDAFPATTIWSYGPESDPIPDSTALGGGAGIAPAPNSQFNYPAYTIETKNDGRLPDGTYANNTATHIRWINDLKDPVTGDFLPHLVPVDETLHWAAPNADCIAGAPRTDCMGQNPDPYRGPVPIITHVHGGHTEPQSDGYPEAWFLPDPAGSNFNCTSNPAVAAANPGTYMCHGTLVNNLGSTTNPGSFGAGFSDFTYRHDQPSTTLWYHDHALGMTRSNVYAGPAGFFLVRTPSGTEDGLVAGVLPGPAPVAGEGLATTNLPESLGGSREKYREIPIVVQDRSFNSDGSLFYPADRAFFEGLGDGFGDIFIGDGTNDSNAAAGLNADTIPAATSDMAPVWNPEAFFNTMVVNGVTWPTQDVAPAIYRFRLLDGCNSRFLNLALQITDQNGAQVTVNRTVWDDTTVPPTASTVAVNELSFFQIATEQSILPQVVKVETNGATKLPGDGTIPPVKPAPDSQQALLMGNAERADVLVDFRGLPDGTIVRMINTGPDAPFGGFPDVPADPATTGQVMQFVVNNGLLGKSPTDEIRAEDGTLQNPLTRATPPESVVLGPVDNALPSTQITRTLALLEEESALVCVVIDAVTGEITQVPGIPPCTVTEDSEPFAPRAAVLGTIDQSGVPSVQLWSDPISTHPNLNATEVWQIENFTADSHPVHLHLVKFNVLGRIDLTGAPSVVSAVDPLNSGMQEWENGWKDTVVTYPGEATKVVATFDIPGLYVWHCHIVEHEDNEMMVPFCVGNSACGGLPLPNAATQAAFTTGLTQ